MRAALAASLMMVAGAAAAQAASCDTYSFADSAGYRAAKVVAKGKTHFQNDDNSQQSAYLLNGDEVVVISSEAGRSCAVYVSPKTSETIGWLPDSALGPAQAKPRWKGRFLRDELGSQAVLKSAKGGTVDVTLEAYWAMSLELAKQGGINEGGMGGIVPVKDGAAHIAAVPAENNNCEADLRLIGSRYLLVEDNRDRLGDDVLSCAGHNVTFTGLYVRTK